MQTGIQLCIPFILDQQRQSQVEVITSSFEEDVYEEASLEYAGNVADVHVKKTEEFEGTYPSIKYLSFILVHRLLEVDLSTWAYEDVKFREGLLTFFPKYQIELERWQKSCPNLILFSQKLCPNETDFCPTWGAAALPALPALNLLHL